MKRCMMGLLLVLTGGPLGAQGPVTDRDFLYVFDLEALPQISLEVSEAEWNRLLEAYDQNPDTEEVVQAQFRFEKAGAVETRLAVGLRLRGNTSRARPEGAKGQGHQRVHTPWRPVHFGLKFGAYEKQGNFRGLQSLNLKYFKDDPTYVKEVYAFDLLRRMGVWLAPYSSYVQLTLQVTGDPRPAYLGVYRMLEPVDETYLQRRFGTSQGGLWKCTHKNGAAADLTPGSLPGRMGRAQTPVNFTYDYKFSKKSFPEAQKALEAWVRGLDQTPAVQLGAWIKDHLAVDLWLKTLAATTAMGSFDDYWNLGNNYYLYLDPQGKAWFIPYDLDNILGTSVLVSDTGTQSPLAWGPPWGRPLVSRVLGVQEFMDGYKLNLRRLVDPWDGLFTKNASQQRIQKWQDLIGDHLANDTRQNQKLADRPASWGQKPDYRLWETGPDTRNFFDTRAQAIRTALGL